MSEQSTAETAHSRFTDITQLKAKNVMLLGGALALGYIAGAMQYSGHELTAVILGTSILFGVTIAAMSLSLVKVVDNLLEWFK